MIELKEIVYDIRARDGTWCKLPYPNHPKGCPNYPVCPNKYPDFKALSGFKWFAVMIEFDLRRYAEMAKEKHPLWTTRQCRNLLYWQGKVRSALRKKIRIYAQPFDIILEIPEACGINVFETMALVGIQIDRHPDIVKKIMLIGKHS